MAASSSDGAEDVTLASLLDEFDTDPLFSFFDVGEESGMQNDSIF